MPLFRGLFAVDGSLLSHGSKNDNICRVISDWISHPNGAVLTSVLVLLGEETLDLFAGLAVWNLDVVLGGAVVRHEGEKAVLADVKLCHR